MEKKQEIQKQEPNTKTRNNNTRNNQQTINKKLVWWQTADYDAEGCALHVKCHTQGLQQPKMP